MTRLRRGNEVREVPLGDTLAKYLMSPPDRNGNVWEPERPDQTVPIGAYRMGRPELQRAPLGRLRDILLSTNGGVHILSSMQDVDQFPSAAEWSRREQMESGAMQAAVGATAGADALTFGGASALQDALSGPGGVATQRNEAFATHPGTAVGATIGTLVAQMALTGGGSALLSGAEAGTAAARTANALRLLSRTGIGGAMEAGGWLGTRAARWFGATEATTAGRAVTTGLRVFGEELGAATAFETAMAIQQDRPFSGESWLESVGIGTALGLGTSSIVNMGSRFWRRARATELADDATQGLREMEQGVADGLTSEDILRMRARGEGILGSEAAVSAGEITSSVDPSDLRLMSHRRAIDIATDEGSLIRSSNEVATSVNEFSLAARNAESYARDDTWLNQLDNEFASVDAARAYSSVATKARSMLDRIDEALDVTRTSHLSDVERAALKALKPEVESLAELSNSAPVARILGRTGSLGRPAQARGAARGIFQELLDTKRAVNANLDKLEVGTISGGIRDEIRAMPHDRTVWGSIGQLQQERDMAFSHLSNAEAGINSTINRDAYSEAGKTRELDGRRLLNLIKDKGRDITDRFDEVRQNMQSASLAAETLGRIGGASEQELAHLRASIAQAQAKFENAAATASIHGSFRSAQSQEIKGHGLLSFMGLGGGLLGGFLGNEMTDSGAGMVGGALAGIAFGYLARPVAGMIRLRRMRQARDRLFQRINTGISHIPHVATRDFVSPSTASRGIRRGVVTYYNMDSENPEKSMSEFLQARRDIEEMVNSPELMQDRLAMTTAGLDDLDPELAVHASTSAIAGLTHLYQTMPKAPMDPLTGEDFAVPPSIEEVETWMRRYAVVEDPLIVLERFVSGRLTGEEMETAWAVYPQITAAITAGVVEQMAGIPGDKIRYDFRLHAATFLGFPTDASLEPTTVAIFANNGYQTEQQARAVQSESPNKPMITRQMSTVGGTSTEVQRLLQ